MTFKVTCDLEAGDVVFAPKGTEVLQVRIISVSPTRAMHRGESRYLVAAVELATGEDFNCDCGEETRWYLPAV
jgi:CO dehydrogenase/acetyl-CoA synthase alpha subunit